MAEILEEVDGSRRISRTEHALRSVINGPIHAVRDGLIRALERLEYVVLTDEPLHARRRARGWASYYSSSNILDYPIKLTIGLRKLSDDATLATFDYLAEHSGAMSLKGDQQTLTREAEAIIAIATSDGSSSSCSSCRTKQIGDGRFCRVCGSPTHIREPAELEVLRLTAGSRGSHHLMLVGFIWTIVAILASVGLFAFGYAPTGLIMGLALTQVLTGLLLLFWGLQVLSSTLKAEPGRTLLPTAALPNELPAASPSLLSAPAQTWASVTENTTHKLTHPANKRQDPLKPRKAKDTSPMD